MSAAAHGTIYIAGLSFVSMRVSAQCRSSRLALCHFGYMLGFSIAAHILCMSPHSWLHDYGVAQLLAGAFAAVLLLVNAMFQFFSVYDYRRSLDVDLQRVNSERVLLYDRKEIIDTLRANAARFPDSVMVVSQVKRRWKLTALTVLLRTNGFMMMVPTVRDQLHTVMVAQRVTALHWSLVAGCGAAVLVCLFCSARKAYLLFGLLAAASLIASLFLPPKVGDLQLPIALYYGFLSVLYPIGDIAIVDTAAFANTELRLCGGFVLEKALLVLFLGLQYYGPLQTVHDDQPHTELVWRAYAIPFLLVGAMMYALVVYVYPNTRGKSLYRIRKEMMGIRMEKRRPPGEPDIAETVHTVLPPVQYAYNSATGTYDFPRKARAPISPLAMPVLNNTETPATRTAAETAGTATAAGNAGAPQTVFFTGSMDNRYDRDLQRMMPGHVFPRALVGGAIFSSIAWSM